MTARNDRHTRPGEMQAAYFCVELHRELAALDNEISRLAATMDRQSRVVALRQHAEATRAELRTMTEQRSKLQSMLTALGHSYPCSHPLKEVLTSS